MAEDLLKFKFSRNASSIIKVIGVGGGGCNAVNHMYLEGIKDVDYIVCNTDSQALENSPVPIKIQLGSTLTEGRGAGNRPEMGEDAALENYDEIKEVLESTTKMLFITAGMGGGTGTGAAPVIAKLAHELDILTIGVVTTPSPSEGKKRFMQAMEGIAKLSEYTDSMLIISNQRLHATYGNLPARQAFKMADNIVRTAVKGVAEIITLPGNINIDFADVYTVMHDSKVFIMGTGYASGKDRAMSAVKMALRSPLLDNNEIKGTKNILLNIISGTEEITIGEIGEIIEFLQKEAGQEADIIWGNGYDATIKEEISVTILCTGFKNASSYLKREEKTIERFFIEENKPIDTPADEEFQAIAEPEKPVIKPEPEYEPVMELKDEPAFQTQKARVENRPAMTKKVAKAPRNSAAKPEAPKESNLDNWFFKRFKGLFEDDEQ